MKILITGVAGFIGSNLADKLINKGFDVIGIDNLSYGLLEQIPKKVIFHNIDIRDNISDIFKNVDYVYHLAAKNCISDCQLNPLETFDINVNGTINVFESAKKHNIKKIIYAESSSIYEGSDIYPTPETENKPQSFYAISKYSTKLIADAYIKNYNMTFTALRYFCVYGPKQDYRRTIPPVFSSFIINILKNRQSIIYGDGQKRRDFIHIDDINDFHLKCINNIKTDNKIFNLGCGINYSINEIYNFISNILNSDIKPIYKNNIDGEAYQNLADITQANNIGWYPKINLEKGLKTSIDFIKNEIKNKKI